MYRGGTTDNGGGLSVGGNQPGGVAGTGMGGSLSVGGGGQPGGVRFRPRQRTSMPPAGQLSSPNYANRLTPTSPAAGAPRSMSGMMQSKNAGAPPSAQYAPAVMANEGRAAPPPQGQSPVPTAPSLAQVQADMARRGVGTQLGQDPRNAALAGFMMGR
jgi:hypothetical protein